MSRPWWDLVQLADQQLQAQNQMQAQQVQMGGMSSAQAAMLGQMQAAMNQNNLYSAQDVCEHGMLRKICKEPECICQHIHES